MTTIAGHEPTKRKVKQYAWMGAIGLVCLFTGLFMGIWLLALKGTEVFEGIAASTEKLTLLWLLFTFFNGLALALGVAVVRGVPRIRDESIDSGNLKGPPASP